MKQTGILMMPEIKILHLTIKKEWFDMIAADIKKEEYREIKQYWWNRMHDGAHMRQFDIVQFKNGYSKDAPTLQAEWKGISIGEPKPEWSGGMTGNHFIIHLGKVLSTTGKPDNL